MAQYYGSSKAERDAALADVAAGGGVLLTTYGMVLHNADHLAGVGGGEGSWDWVVCDEVCMCEYGFVSSALDRGDAGALLSSCGNGRG